MINLNVTSVGFQAVNNNFKFKKPEERSLVQNTIAPEAPKAKVSPALAQVVFGVQPSPSFGGKKKQGDEATQWVNSLPFAQDISPEDRRNLSSVIRKKDEETDYMKKMIHLVCKDMVTPQATASLCKHGVMSDLVKRDIDTYYDKVKGEGMSVKDAFVPQYTTQAEAEQVTPVGDVFRVEGQDRICIKSDDDQSQQLKMDADTYLKLYPPVERFASCQNGNGDCYLLSSINSIMENPYTRATVYQCFEQDGDDVTVKLPDAATETKFEGTKMPADIDTEKFTEGPLGMKMLERAYGVEVEHQLYDRFTEIVDTECAQMEKKLAQMEKAGKQDERSVKRQEKLEKKLAGWQENKAKVDEAMQDPNHTIVFVQDDYGELVIGKKGPVTQEVQEADEEYTVPADFYTGGLGGFMDEATRNFGFDSTDYVVGENDAEIDAALLSENPHDYLITAGTFPEEEGEMETPQEKSYSIYSSHAYKVLPFDDEEGNRKFKVTNPWNQSHTVVMEMEHLKTFFQDFAIAKVRETGAEEEQAA